MATRIETDTFGPIDVDTTRYWGAQTQRSLENFKIGTEKMPRALIRALGIVKYCSAEVNDDLGKLDHLLHFEYSDDFSTRARVVTQFKKPIKVLEGPDCWEAVYEEMEQHCIRGHKEEATELRVGTPVKGKQTI